MSSSFAPPPEAGRASRPVWKRWWFWAIVLVVILIAAGAGSSQTTQTEPEAGSPSPMASAAVGEETAASPVAEMARVPNVGGKSLDVATSRLEAAGFVVDVETKLTNAAPVGKVLQQSERAGSRIEVGGTVTLTVAKALPKIPDVVGKTLANAKRALAKAGFEVGKVTQRTSSQPKGTVISQTPAAGTSARPGRTVSVVTAKPAPEPTGECTPGYSPCLPLGPSDYDCYGGSGNGPAYTDPGVTYRVTGYDRYDLDSDNNGYGCE